MRWTIVRLIWFRELRDQLRDRRTLFMIAVLPVFLYPIAGYGLLQLAIGFFTNKSRVLVVGGDVWAQPSVRSAVSWLSAGTGGVGQFAAASALARAPGLEYPSLFEVSDGHPQFCRQFLDSPGEASAIQLRLDDSPFLGSAEDGKRGVALGRYRVDRSRLDSHEVDLIVFIDPEFARTVQDGGRPAVYLIGREGDDRSRLINKRVTGILNRWKVALRDVRLNLAGLPASYVDPFDLCDPEKARPINTRAANELFDVAVKIFPFVLVMWSLAGALYPAVDLCAGEKERGTMETLLISPASREEIVYGKFLTIWVFSAATALLNLLSMGLTTWEFSARFDAGAFRPSVLGWGIILLLPLSAFFSALCLSVGAYARSSKEGQYYLMPLFFVTMPLIFLTLAPGVELNPFYSMVPVTGVALLLQKLMVAGTPDRQLWLYFVPVLAPMVIYGWLALRWAIEQFNREEVLFREAERMDVALYLRRLFRDKEALPSTGQALFCFALILGLHRFTLGFGNRIPLLVQLLVSYLAFVASPALFMALLLTTKPRVGLGLRFPPWWALGVAVVLAFLLFVPGVEIAYLTIKGLGVPIGASPIENGIAVATPRSPNWTDALLAGAGVALLSASCEELAFRGFILSGLKRRFRPWTAVLLSSFLFALFQMNVFQFVPHFALGVVMGILVQRTGSLLPAVAFHFSYNFLVYSCLAIAPAAFPEVFNALAYSEVSQAPHGLVRLLLAAVCIVSAAGILVAIVLPTGMRRPHPHQRRHSSISEAISPVQPV